MIETIDKFFALDFDRCLGNFEANVSLMNEIVADLSILNGDILQQAHDEIKASGMPFRILQYLQDNDPNLDLDNLINTYVARAHNFPGSLVEPGASELLDHLRQRNYHFCIMTFGDEKWQTTKLLASGFGDIVKLIVSHEQKSRHIVEWQDKEKAILLSLESVLSIRNQELLLKLF